MSPLDFILRSGRAALHKLSRRSELSRRSDSRALSSGPLNPFPAATHSGTRTNTTFMPLDFRHELRRQDWREILKKSRYLRNATGIVRALYEKPVKFICPGGLTPSASTPDEDFNERADEYFERWATAPVDVTRTYNFYESIEMIATELPCDGSHFALKVKDYAGIRCQLQFFKAHQIDDPPYANRSDNFCNGILRNAVGRPIQYRTLQDDKTAGAVAHRDYSAEDMLHIYDPLRLSFGRGLPWIYHGANPALDILDMRALDQVARKLNLMLAGVIKRMGQNRGGGAGMGPRMSADDMAALVNAANGSYTPPPAEATSSTSPITFEQILGGGAIPILGEGEEFQNITADRSPTNWIEASDFLIREICAGYGVSFEFLWNMAAMGGATARFILEDLAAFCEKVRRILIGRYCQSTRSWVIANGIIHGELEEPREGNWWDCVWTGPAKVTVDRGREGALYVRLLEKGLITLDEWWSFLGKDARRMRRKRISEIREDLQECQRQGVPYTLYCATAPGSANPTGDAGGVIPISDIAQPGSPFAQAFTRLLETDANFLDAVTAALDQHRRAA